MNLWFFCFNLFYLMKIFYSIVMAFDIHQHESSVGVYVSLPS